MLEAARLDFLAAASDSVSGDHAADAEKTGDFGSAGGDERVILAAEQECFEQIFFEQIRSGRRSVKISVRDERRFVDRDAHVARRRDVRKIARETIRQIDRRRCICVSHFFCGLESRKRMTPREHRGFEQRAGDMFLERAQPETGQTNRTSDPNVVADFCAAS